MQHMTLLGCGVGGRNRTSSSGRGVLSAASRSSKGRSVEKLSMMVSIVRCGVRAGGTIELASTMPASVTTPGRTT